jgi:hypothetical protein
LAGSLFDEDQVHNLRLAEVVFEPTIATLMRAPLLSLLSKSRGLQALKGQVVEFNPTQEEVRL